MNDEKYYTMQAICPSIKGQETSVHSSTGKNCASSASNESIHSPFFFFNFNILVYLKINI